jgi:hypothetical protein
MTRQYAAKRQRIVASVANTRVSVVSRVRVDPIDRSRKLMTAMAKPGERITVNVAAVIRGGGFALAALGAATNVPRTISLGGSSARR